MATSEHNGHLLDGETPEPIQGDRGAPILGPRNIPVERENRSLLAPPPTDSGTVPNLKFPFAAARNRILSGGWAREVTTRELPVATDIAGVNMRLKPGGIREMHWHKEAEWAYMIAGTARITAVDADGCNFIDDVGVGDLWYFPAGIPHSIQGLADGCEFLLVFDYENDRYLFAGEIPPPLSQDAVSAPNGPVPQTFSHRMLAQEPIETSGGRVRITDSTNFPISRTIAAALVEVEPGGLRELHWHPNADEWQYYLSGQGRMAVFASSGRSRTFDYQAGDVGYVPFAMGHYVENTGEETLVFLETFRSDAFADISLNQWMALSPPELVRAHLNLDQPTIAALSAHKPIVVR
jgi:oxalate decarboxylase